MARAPGSAVGPRGWRLGACAVLVAASVSAAQAADAAAATLWGLDGVWVGPGCYLLLDVERMQGSTNPEKPFERRPLVVRSIDGAMVTLSIGAKTFFVTRRDDKLSVSGLGLEPVDLNRTGP